MKTWQASLFLGAVVCVQLQTLASCSPVAGCCGPLPDPHDCSCRMLHGREEVSCYYSKFIGSEASATAPQFTAYPQAGTFVSGVEVTLSCSVSYAASPTSCPLSVIWEHNGTVVDSSSGMALDDVFDADNDVYHSTLTIPQFSASAQGDYVCRVGEMTSSITSPAANLQLPKFLGWIDRAYPPPPDANSVSLTVQKGGSVILECSPSTTESLEGRVPQLDTKTATLSLPSGSVLMPGVQKDANVSCVWPLREAQTRHFLIFVSPDSPAGDLRLAVRPADTVVAAGSSLELFCIAEGPGSASVLWSRDGLAVEEGVLVVGGGQVLEVKGATASDGGTYTCSVSDRVQSVNTSAVVTVVDPPGSVALSVDGATSGLHIDRQTGIVVVSPSLNSSLWLSCHVDTSTALHYQWLHGGVVAAEGEGRETLVLPTSDLPGSYQCIVSNIAGRQSSQPLWITFDEAKPHPPVNVRVAKNTWSGVYFQYDIYWDRPEEGWAVTGYTVETLSMRDETAAQHCSCVDRHSEETNTMFAFQAGCSGSSLNRDHSLYYRVAANTKDSQSSFIAGEPVLVTTGAPPGPADLAVEEELATNKWDLSLSWRNQHTSSYNRGCYDTTVIPPCTTTSIQMVYSPVTASMNCCTTCQWSVTNINRVYPDRSSTNTSNHTTPAIRPSAPPQLISVKRLGTSGNNFSVSFELPDDSKSCMCRVGDHYEVTVKTNATSIDNVSTTVSLSDSHFNVTIPGAHCSAAYYISLSLAFHNSKGMSDFSSPLTVGLPSGRNIPTFSEHPLKYEAVDWSEVAVSYQLEQGAGCLLAERLLLSNICHAPSQSDHKCSPALLQNPDTNCTSIDREQGQLSLPRYHAFCVVVHVWSDLLDMSVSTRTLSVPSSEGLPSKQPQHLSLSLANGSLDISWSAPPVDSWQGLPYNYSLNISTVGGELMDSTTLPFQSHSLVYQDYNSSLAYNVTISACTRVGCGPIATKVLPKQSSEDPSVNDDVQPPTDEPSTGSGSQLIVEVVTSSTLFLVALVALVSIITISCTCYRRRHKKKYDRLRTETVPDFRTAQLEEEEPLVGSREPPTGALARSEYTDFESLCSGDPRVVDWVKQTASLHRDSYVRDADEELALWQEQDTTPPNDPPLAPPTGMPTQTPSSNGYCSESGGSLQRSPAVRNSGSDSAASTGAAPLSSGYSTEPHLTQVPSGPPAEHTICGQSRAAYTGIHNLTCGEAQPPLPVSLTTTGNYQSNTKNPLVPQTTDFMTTADFISSLLCQEDFNPPSAGSQFWLNTNSTLHSSLESTELIPDPASPYTPSDSLSPSPPTTSSGHPVQSAGREEEETDSVFDTSVSPVRHSTSQGPPPPGRTRSSVTSGFLSLSNSSLNSSDNMEMTPIHSHTHCPGAMPPRSACPHSCTSWTPPSQQPAPVIPSLLSCQLQTSGSLPPPPPVGIPLSFYENIDGHPLAHEGVRFEL